MVMAAAMVAMMVPTGAPFFFVYKLVDWGALVPRPSRSR
jgi:hypothetical protein